jgi:hypothetical protein
MIYAEILSKDLKKYEIIFYWEKSDKEDILWNKRIKELTDNGILVQSMVGRWFILSYLATREFIPSGKDFFYKK